jgi:hypothetical protein
VLLAGIFAVIAAAAAVAVVNYISVLRPLKYDLYIYRVDAVFGEPSFFLGRVVQRSRALQDLVSISYGMLTMVFVGVFIVYLYERSEAEVALLLRAFVLNLFLAVPIYFLIPVCGPQFAFLAFPSLPPPIVPHPIALAAAPNGIPSVHAAGALLIWWFLRGWRIGSLFGCVFLALTILATLGSGKHYFFDLLCAVPYAAGVYWISWRTNGWASRAERMEPRVPA